MFGVSALEGADRQSDILCTACQNAEAICASLAGSALLQNGQMTAEIQEEVALTNLGSSSGASKRHSAADKMHFPRSNLQTITTLGMLGHAGPDPTPAENLWLKPQHMLARKLDMLGYRVACSCWAVKYCAVLMFVVFPCAALHFQAGGSLVKCSWPRQKVQRMVRGKPWFW